MTGYGLMTERWGWQPTGRMLGGLPTWSWRCAPPGLLTRRRMRTAGLAPGGAEPVAQVIGKRGRRKAYLYDPAELKPKRTPSPAQLQAVAKALQARRWCPTGRHYADYCIPTSLGECVECHYSNVGDDSRAVGADTSNGSGAGQDDAQERTEHELAEASESAAPAESGVALDRARAAVERLHEQARADQRRWMPIQAGPAAWCAGDVLDEQAAPYVGEVVA